MRTEVNGRLLDAQNVDSVEQGAGEELATRAAVGLAPRLREVSDVADGDVGGDGLRGIPVLRLRLISVESDHRPFEAEASRSRR